MGGNRIGYGIILKINHRLLLTTATGRDPTALPRRDEEGGTAGAAGVWLNTA